MIITDELREWARGLFNTRETVLAIADRIDTTHESEISRAAQLLADAEKDRDFNYANWQDCKQKVLQHNITMDELSAEIERLKDDLAHCIELPKDAGGEYIHIGDKVTCGASVWEVTGFRFAGGFWGICCTTFFNNQGGSGTNVYPTSELHHYRASTVEDVLTEFGIDWEYEDNCEDRAALLKEYAAKLQLKEQS